VVVPPVSGAPHVLSTQIGALTFTGTSAVVAGATVIPLTLLSVVLAVEPPAFWLAPVPLRQLLETHTGAFTLTGTAAAVAGATVRPPRVVLPLEPAVLLPPP